MSECISCGRGGVELFDVGCVNPKMRVCSPCLFKYGKAVLREAADVALKWVLDPKNRSNGRRGGRCGHCPDPVVLTPDGSYPLLCSRCSRSLAALRAS